MRKEEGRSVLSGNKGLLSPAARLRVTGTQPGVLGGNPLPNGAGLKGLLVAPPEGSLILLQKKRGGREPTTENTTRSSSTR